MSFEKKRRYNALNGTRIYLVYLVQQGFFYFFKSKFQLVFGFSPARSRVIFAVTNSVQGQRGIHDFFPLWIPRYSTTEGIVDSTKVHFTLYILRSSCYLKLKPQFPWDLWKAFSKSTNLSQIRGFHFFPLLFSTNLWKKIVDSTLPLHTY